jgi:PAS domain S-box-containing protein
MSAALHILVVDDDRAHAEFVRELLRMDVAREAAVDIAVSYDEALRLLREREFDVALFDYMLDRGDGVSLLREVRAAGNDIPVIMLTGRGDEEIAVDAMKAGASDYLSKSNLTDDTIGSALRHALSLGATERQRRAAEQALREREERFRALVENSSDFLVLADEEGRITYTTPAAARRFGWDPADIVGQQLFHFIHPDDLPRCRTRFDDALGKPGQPVAAEVRFRHLDGTYRTLEGISVNRLHEPAVRSVVINARDVTERRSLEDQLRQVQKMEAVGRLAGGIAHDFNNLLTAILGYCNLLLDELPPESTVREDLEEIRKAGDRAATLTRQLLAFSRRQMLQPQPVAVGTLIREMEKMIHRLVGDDVEVVLALAEPLPQVKADPASIEQIIINLAVNARDAMPAGGRLTIEASTVDLDSEYTALHPSVIPGRYVMVAITDTGGGMDADTRARVFEPFFTTKEQGRGTGLGLATVYGLVKQSGGYIWVYSEPGHGTVFKVYLPSLADHATRRATATQTEASGTETILIVEDDAPVRALASEALRRHGYMVLEAADGLEALRVVERHQDAIALIITDVVMPQMTGRELASRLRDARPAMKLLFISGFPDHAVTGEIDASESFLQKPFTPDALARTVREILDREIARPS